MIREYQPTRDPGGAWDREQARQVEVADAALQRERFEPYVSPEERRIRELEACLRDYERDFGCDHTSDESACCNSCHARRLLGLPRPAPTL